mmetsp:Transcript_93991/g.205851  ORF Transcript_93991/g.205851 Transcript_93991/m.205851 type:complete len:259 (-) Transcript_93991:373-1149(-)
MYRSFHRNHPIDPSAGMQPKPRKAGRAAPISSAVAPKPLWLKTRAFTSKASVHHSAHTRSRPRTVMVAGDRSRWTMESGSEGQSNFPVSRSSCTLGSCVTMSVSAKSIQWLVPTHSKRSSREAAQSKNWFSSSNAWRGGSFQFLGIWSPARKCRPIIGPLGNSRRSSRRWKAAEGLKSSRNRSEWSLGLRRPKAAACCGLAARAAGVKRWFETMRITLAWLPRIRSGSSSNSAILSFMLKATGNAAIVPNIRQSKAAG